MEKVILTGSAHSGKTTILNILGYYGSNIVHEAETPFVSELNRRWGQDKTKRVIMNNYSVFKKIVGKRQAELDKKAEKKYKDNEIVFFDRSAICYIAYCKLRDAEVPQILEELAQGETAAHVFFMKQLDHFSERRDTGRFMKKEEAEKLDYLIRQEYENRGFKLVYVEPFPDDMQESIRSRFNFIRDYIKSHN